MGKEKERKINLIKSIKLRGIKVGTLLRKIGTEYYCIVLGMKYDNFNNKVTLSCLFFKQLPTEEEIKASIASIIQNDYFYCRYRKEIEIEKELLDYEVYGRVSYSVEKEILLSSSLSSYTETLKNELNYAEIERKARIGTVLRLDNLFYYIIIGTNPYELLQLYSLNNKISEKELIDIIVENKDFIYIEKVSDLTSFQKSIYYYTIDESKILKIRNKLKLLCII